MALFASEFLINHGSAARALRKGLAAEVSAESLPVVATIIGNTRARMHPACSEAGTPHAVPPFVEAWGRDTSADPREAIQRGKTAADVQHDANPSASSPFP